jgi:arylsulfatase A
MRFIYFILTLLLFGCAARKEQISSNQKFNIILIVADDLGRNDLACYSNEFIETPKLDQLSREGIQCMNGYAAAPLCSPSRASIITGNNPTRINLTEHLHGYSPPSPKQKLITPRIEIGLPPQLVTIPEALKPILENGILAEGLQVQPLKGLTMSMAVEQKDFLKHFFIHSSMENRIQIY